VSDRRNTLISNTCIRPLTGAVLGLLAAGSLGLAQAASTICEPDGGYVVAYYNGTFATPEDADAQRAALRISRHGKYTGTAETATTTTGKVEPVRYETFYSTAGTASGATESRFQALAGEYRKLLDGALTQNWEYFWDMASGNTDNWSVLAAKSGDSRFLAITAAYPATVSSLAAKAKSDLDADLKVSTTMGARQLARAQALYTERQKLLMVGYSQGMLFADKAFARLGAPTDNTVRKQEIAAVPAAALQSSLTTNMAALNIPTPTSNQGFFTATLSWSAPAAAVGTNGDGTAKQNDFDLHVIEPTPPATGSTYVQWVHFSTTGDPGKGGGGDISKQGYAGYLDKDSLGLTATDMGPEHYYASCDEAKLLPGTYWVSVTTVRAQLPAQTFATLQIATAKSGEVYSKTFNYSDIPGFIQQTKLTFPVKVVLSKNADGTWAKPEVTPYSPAATYEFSGLPTFKL
jgi:hypothetical protein